MCAYNPYYPPPPYPYYSYPSPYPYQGFPPAQYPCIRCNSPMVFVPMYQEWYCPRCQKYASELDEEPEELGKEEVKKVRPQKKERAREAPPRKVVKKRETQRRAEREYQPYKPRRCVICNTENIPSDKYCRECGHHLFRCRSCGNKNESGSETCASCGARLE